MVSNSAPAVPGDHGVVTKMAIVAASVLFIGAVQLVCVLLSEQSDNASGPFLLVGAVCGMWYAMIQLIHLRYFSRHRDLAKPQNLRKYYWGALVSALLFVIAGTFGLLPGLGVKIAEALQVCTLGLTLLWFHLAKILRTNPTPHHAV
jgi:uncharacterized membrane-anchored protein